MHLVKCSKTKENKVTKVFAAIPFALGSILSGISYAKSFIFSCAMDAKAPPETTFYRAQKIVCDVLNDMAKTSCDNYKNQMPNADGIEFDGSWSQRREAPFCFVQFISTSLKKIVDYEIVSKKINYEGPSNQMEGAGLAKLFARWMTNPKVTKYVHDGDVKATKIMKDMGWNILEANDPGHLLKNIKKAYDGLKLKNAQGLKNHLFRFAHILINSKLSKSDKAKYWVNAINHYCGNHENCLIENCKGFLWKGCNDKESVQKLQKFLEDTKYIFEKIIPGLDTQACEAVNHMKERKAEKSISWKNSYIARIAAVVFQKNEGLFSLVVNARLKLKLGVLSPYIFKIFRMYCSKRDKINAIRRQPQARKLINQKRAKKRGEMIPDDINNIFRHK